MNAAVVVAGIHDRWDEPQLVARRLAGALAHRGRVSILVGGRRVDARREGMFDVFEYPCAPPDDARAVLLGRALAAAGTITKRGGPGQSVRRLEEEYFLALGEYAPGLVARVSEGEFDLVVFVGATSGHFVFGSRVVPPTVPMFVAPLPRSRQVLQLATVREALLHADTLLFTTSSEARDVEEAIPEVTSVRRSVVGTVVRTNELATQAFPNAFPDEPVVVVVADWLKVRDWPLWARWAGMANRELSQRGQVRAIGPGAARLPRGFAGESSASRIDLWRWMSHAVAVVDPMPYSCVGIPALEALSFGVSLLAPADSGATRAHAEDSNGGLWFRTYDEFVRSVDHLLDHPSQRAALGRNGQRYADTGFSDTKGFVDGVLDAVARPA